MSKILKTTYSLKDGAIVPAITTNVEHRSDIEVNTTICGQKRLPIFVAPMGAVTNENNYKTWLENGVTPVIPRTVGTRLSFAERVNLSKETFVSFSLDEAKAFLYEASFSNMVFPKLEKGEKYYVCIDLANGHMTKLLDLCASLKAKYYNSIVIMTGNVARPETYIEYCNAHIDYARICIGDGSMCTTSANVGVHYGMLTLLDDIHTIREHLLQKNPSAFTTKVVPDGGIYDFDDINKCFALGADAVMCGRVFAECEEACGDTIWAKSEKLAAMDIGFKDPSVISDAKNYSQYRLYYGMSTKLAQKETGGKGDKTAEGIVRYVKVKHPVAKWLDNMASYLRSAMSYANSFTLDEFRKNAKLVILGGGDSSYRK